MCGVTELGNGILLINAIPTRSCRSFDSANICYYRSQKFDFSGAWGSWMLQLCNKNDVLGLGLEQFRSEILREDALIPDIRDNKGRHPYRTTAPEPW